MIVLEKVKGGAYLHAGNGSFFDFLVNICSLESPQGTFVQVSHIGPRVK